MDERKSAERKKFTAGHVGHYLKKGRYVDRVGSSGPIGLAAVLEYLAADLAGNVAQYNKKTRLMPRHLLLATRNDEELSKMLDGITIAHSGVLPNIHFVLFSKKANMQ
ncbi:protein H2A.5-like [Triticum dicoccoides]|uniref:protein H2A.5-like n=1 Tax=Triticum dicoccoides TaxID=85692 RepID=UPI001890137D|nr:protein H2A.5-like [Triticum dicoccoides]XP_044336317.1 protein H2A.5-like [Triticum aestivum]